MSSSFSRRAMLRGAGVALSLPWLEALVPRVARAAPVIPHRLLVCVFPNGAATDWWTGAPGFGQTLTGDAWVLPNVLSPFQALKKKMLMISRLGNYTWSHVNDPVPQVEPSHARCLAASTTCVDADQIGRAANLPLDSAVRSVTSVDQLVAQKYAGLTPMPSMQTGLGVKPGFFDGRSYAYNQVISWADPTSPLKRSVNPRAVFDALVGAQTSQDPTKLAQIAAQQKSVIDAVREDTLRIKGKVSSRDQKILDQYLDTVRTIELNASKVSTAMCRTIPRPDAVPEPPGPQQGLTQGDNGYDHEKHADVMNDLISLAFECDRTRVVTHLLDDARSEFEYRNIPAADRLRVGNEYHEGDSLHYHACQHGDGAISDDVANGRYTVTTPSNRGFATITGWMCRKVAELATRLDSIQEGEGTVLDHTTVVFMSEMRTHDHDGFDLPLVVLGGGGTFKTNQHIALQPIPNDRQLRDFWFTMLRRNFAMPVTSFGEDSRGVSNSELSEVLT